MIDGDTNDCEKEDIELSDIAHAFDHVDETQWDDRSVSASASSQSSDAVNGMTEVSVQVHRVSRVML